LLKKILTLTLTLALVACAGTRRASDIATPNVDYIETLDVARAPNADSFLVLLAMNYQSYAVYNARTAGYIDVGELFAGKAISAFSGETPFPEALDAWPIADDNLRFDLQQACKDLIESLKNNVADTCPEAAAEAQAKYDCWLSASSIGNYATADECRVRFTRAMSVLRGGENGGCAATKKRTVKQQQAYYPDTRNLSSVNGMRAREGVVIVNNINIPTNLITPEPVAPVTFNQNITYSGEHGARVIDDTGVVAAEVIVDDNLVSRDEFINMMMALRAELAAIHARLDVEPAEIIHTEKMREVIVEDPETVMLKVQQIPLEPEQSIMEEIFEIGFDFDKSVIKPEYKELIRKLAESAQNRNVRVSVVGHTDTAGSRAYNYALGGRRAEAVRKMLVANGIPAERIFAVSSGESDLKVQTGDGVPNAANRRVRVVKETSVMTEPDGVEYEYVIAGEPVFVRE
jgi:outer membrane protein OmpA-like peptidoglycan-associated protein